MGLHSSLRKLGGTLVLSILCTGCVTTVTPPRSLFESDRPFYSRLFSVSADPGSDGSGLPGGRTTVNALDAYAGYRAIAKQAEDPGAKPEVRRTLLREGMAIVEYRCGLYFDVLGKAIQELSFTRRETSLIGVLAQSSMGLAGQSAKSIANTGALFGFTTATMDAYQDVYLYTPEIDTIRRLVFSALVTNAGVINAAVDGYDLDYGQVISLLKQYESVCQPGSIRSLVNQAVSDGTVRTSKAETVSAANLDQVRASLAVSLQQVYTTEDDAFYVYWLQSDRYDAKADSEYISGRLRGIPTLLKNGIADPAIAKAKATPFFKLLSSDVLRAWNARIDDNKRLNSEMIKLKRGAGLSGSTDAAREPASVVSIDPTVTETAKTAAEGAQDDTNKVKRLGTPLPSVRLEDVKKGE